MPNYKKDSILAGIAREKLAQLRAQQVKLVDYSNERVEDFMVRLNEPMSRKPPYERPLHLGEALDYLNDIVQGKSVRLLLSVPPRHSKSETILHVIAKVLSKDPTKRVGYVTYGEDLSVEQSRKLRAICEAADVPLSTQVRAATDWKTKAGGGVVAVGLGGPLTGRGFDLIVVDDPYKARQDAESALLRQRVLDYYDSAVSTRLEPGGSIIIVHTRFHVDDLIATLLARDTSNRDTSSREGWVYVNYPALKESADGELESLWPSRYSVQDLLKKKAQNAYEFSALYQGSPRPRNGSVFNDVQYYDALPDGVPDQKAIGIDLAYTAKSYADYSVSVTALKYGNFIYITNVRRKQMEIAQFAQELRAEKSQHMSAPIFWYVGGIEKSHLPTLLRMGLYIRTENAGKSDKYVRATPVATAWNQKRVLIPYPEAAPWVKDFIDEILSFTGNGDKHDDQVDALAAAYHLLGYKSTGRGGMGQRRILPF